MVFGMPTLIENETLGQNAALCAQLGLDFLEINMNLPDFQLEKLDARRVNELAARHGVFFTLHLDENLNIADFNRSVARAYTETALAAVDFAQKIGAPLVNMHMNHGVHFTLPDGKVFLFEKYRGSYLADFARFAALCEGRIGESGVKICVENTDGFKPFERAALDLLLQSPAFALTWDIGHSVSADEADEDFLLARRPRLAHFHIHDGSRRANGAKSHLALGCGEIDLGGRLRLARECNARCVVETKTASALRDSVAWLKAHGWL